MSNFFLLYLYCINEAIFNRLNLCLSQKAGPLNIFLDKLCSSSVNETENTFSLKARAELT